MMPICAFVFYKFSTAWRHRRAAYGTIATHPFAEMPHRDIGAAGMYLDGLQAADGSAHREGTDGWHGFRQESIGPGILSKDSYVEAKSRLEALDKKDAERRKTTESKNNPEEYIYATREKVTDKPVLVYPNSGETYDPDRKEWVASNSVGDEDFVSYVSKWCEARASLVGGCCRTTPKTIKAISKAMHHEYVESQIV